MPAKPGHPRPHEERRTYARRPPVEPLPGEPELGDSFLIITEGEVTERMYFEALREALLVNPVTVRIVHPSCTDAEGLVRAAVEERDAPVGRRDRCQAGKPGFDFLMAQKAGTHDSTELTGDNRGNRVAPCHNL